MTNKDKQEICKMFVEILEEAFKDKYYFSQWDSSNEILKPLYFAANKYSMILDKKEN